MGLTWTFAVLFLLFGLPLFFLQDPEWARRSAGMSTLWLGCFALAWARHAVTVGRIKLQFSWIRRASRPRLFWATIAMLVIAGAGTIIAAIWALFFKT